MKDFWEKCGASQKHVGHDCTEQWRGRGKREGEREEKEWDREAETDKEAERQTERKR